MYGMNNSGNLFSDELTNGLIDEAGFNQSKYQITAYCKFALDGSTLVVIYYVDDCAYLYTSEAIEKWFVNKIEKIFHMDILEYSHRFMSVNISQLKNH